MTLSTRSEETPKASAALRTRKMRLCVGAGGSWKAKCFHPEAVMPPTVKTERSSSSSSVLDPSLSRAIMTPSEVSLWEGRLRSPETNCASKLRERPVSAPERSVALRLVYTLGAPASSRAK